LNETNILKSLHHPNLVIVNISSFFDQNTFTVEFWPASFQVQVIGVCTEHQWIVLEFLPGGELIGYLRDKKNGRASTSKLIEIAEDVGVRICYAKHKPLKFKSFYYTLPFRLLVG